MRSGIGILLLLAAVAPAQTYRGLIGVGIDGGYEGSPSRMWVDLGKVFRVPQKLDWSGNAAIDGDGWPTQDFNTVIFDVRPAPSWLPGVPADDPEKFQPDFSGVYSLEFKGQAEVSATGGTPALSYDAASNTTRGTLTVPSGTGLLILTFRNTKRTPSDAAGTGITGLRIIRPGYPADTTQTFTSEFLEALRPFAVLRFMGFLETNGADPRYPLTKEWSDRHLPTDATQQPWGGRIGVAWEYLIQIANESGKDIWINIPVSASDDYVTRLAELMKSNLKPGIKIYVEHGNEVWNGIFSGYPWNTAAAAGDDSVKTNPPSPYSNIHAVRRHAKRTVEIGKIFKRVYGDESHDIIRPVFSWWILKVSEYREALTWVAANYGGDVSKVIWGIAQTHYFNDSGAAARVEGASVDTVLDVMTANSDAGASSARALHAVAKEFGVQHVTYEAGPDNSDVEAGPTAKVPNIGNRILANRAPRMKSLLIRDVKNNWFDLAPGEYGLYMNLSLASGYARWGSWGLVEDVKLLDTPKMEAMYELTAPSPVLKAVVDGASYQTPITPGAFISLYGEGFSDRQAWWSAAGDGTLPEKVAGVQVTVGGRPAIVNYVGYGQVNVLAPPDVQGTEAVVEIATAGGRSSMTVPLAAASPRFFGYYLGQTFYPSAVFANTGIYVAAEGALPSVSTRPARKDDYLELYITGLPHPAAAPFGKVLDRAYEIDRSNVAVTIDGIAASVEWVGLRYAGVFQVNIRVPELARGGELPLVLSVNGRQTQPAVLAFAK